MQYEIDVLDAAKTRIAVLAGCVRAELRESVNGIGILTVETVSPNDSAAIMPGLTFLRVRAVPGGGRGIYRVIGAALSRTRERISLTATARHIIADTTDEIIDGAVDCIGRTPAQLAAIVLGASAFGVGTVEPATPVPYVRFEYERVWDCLIRICELTGGELSLDTVTNEIDILSRVGTDRGAVMRYGVNLTGASRTIDTSRFVNRVYAAGGGNPPMTLTGATESGGARYVEDAESIAAWGLREGVYHNPSLDDIENLVATPALNGDYTDGLCEDWTTAGTPSLSRNDDPGSCLYGGVSQRVETASDGEGIGQMVTVTPGGVYSLVANVFIASGTVRVKILDGTAVYRRAEAVTGTGLATVRIENWKAIGSTVAVRIAQEGAGTADFCVDSVQIAAGPDAKAFTVGKTADILYDRAAEFLESRSAPEISYDVTFTDADPEGFGIGDDVRVIDETLGMDVKPRIMERKLDLLRPWRMSVRLDTPSRGLADVLEALRKSQEEGVRHMRAVMAESSTTAETGSARLGFSNYTVRFSGALSATVWDAVGWTAGTLRAGDFYYAVEAGSLTGLDGSSTHYVYFDRTDPETFGVTTDIAEAETGDRALVFAAVTTVSPALPTIHAFGIVQG